MADLPRHVMPDANGNLTRITLPGRPAHIFNYNAFDLEGQYTPPSISGIATPQTVYDYDEQGCSSAASAGCTGAANLDKQLIRITRPDGQTLDFQYNATTGQLNTLTTGNTGQGNRDYSYTYIPTSGQLDTITSPDNIVLDYGYDGFLLKEVDWTGAINGSLDISYNNNFLISQRCVNTTNCISFTYDDDNLLTHAGSLILTRDPQRAGLITDTTLSTLTTANSYNGFGELESMDAEYASTQYFNTVYTRDELGRIESKTETVQGVTVTDVYTYDLAGRLDTVTRGSDVITYEYDTNGNRESKLLNSVAIETGVYDDQDRLISYNGCSYGYSDNGELQSKTCGTDITTYSYDLLGNLINVTLSASEGSSQIEYIIDGQNRRVGKRVNETLTQGFLYTDQLNPIAELDSSGNIQSRFIYADKINVPSYMIRGGETYRIISDHLGSPRLVVNVNDGAVAQRVDYDEFGRVANDTNPGFQPFGFAGGLYDSQTGLVRFGARDYDAQTGRWTTKDPILFNGGVNLYGYAINDPINVVDYNGENPFAIIGAVIGAGLNAANNYQAYKSGQITGAQYAQTIAVGGLTGALSGFGVGLIGSTIVGSLTSAANTGITNLITANSCDDIASGVVNGAIGGGVGGLATAAGQSVGSRFTESVIGAAVKGPLKNFSTPGGVVGFAIGTLIGAAL